MHDRLCNEFLQCWLFVTHYMLQNFEIMITYMSLVFLQGYAQLNMKVR